MGEDSRRLSTDAVGEALASFHERLAAGDAFSSPLVEGLDADEMTLVLRLQDCLVRLERVRADEPSDRHSGNDSGSTANALRGSTYPSLQHEEPTPGERSDLSEADGDKVARTDVDSATTSGTGRIGRFDIVRVLGRGGQGLMLLAHDPVLARRVALKVPWSETLITPQLRRRFLREAQAVARLTHPHIVAVYDVGEVGPICFIASAFVEGQSLAAWLKQRAAPMDPRQAATIIADLADAMHYAHGQGVLHRDLKPGNVLLETQASDSPRDAAGQLPWVAKITDFGLAKIVDSDGDDTGAGAIIGTVAYMSPEQAKAEHGAVGPPTDIYAFGAILYELLTGRAPFRASSDAETLRLVVSEQPIAPRRVNPKCPPDLEAICLKCLEKAPAARYQSAGKLAADLLRFLAGEPTLVRPLSTLGQVVRWSGRNRRVAALLATVAGLLLCVTVVSTVAAVRISQARDEAEQALLAEKKSLSKALAAEHAAEAERATAETQTAKAAQVSDFLVNLFMTADPLGVGKLGFRQGDEIGANLTLREVLDRGSKQSRNALKNQPLARATLLDTLGKVYSDLGLVSQAEPLVREAYELRLAHPDNEADLAKSLMNMGVLSRWTGEYTESERLLRRALEIRTRLHGEQSLAVAETKLALGWALMECQRFGSSDYQRRELEFDKLFQDALAVQQRELGGSHRDVGLTYMLLSLRHSLVHNQAETTKMFKQAVAVFILQDGGLPLAQTLLDFQQGTQARAKGQYTRAEKHYRAALNTAQKLLGRGNPMTLAIAGELAGTLRTAGRPDEFEQLSDEISQAVQQAFPNGHPFMIEGVNEWVPFIATQGRFDEAVALVKKRMAIEDRFLGPSPLRKAQGTLEIALYRIDQGKLDEASRLLDELDQMRNVLQAENPDLVAKFTWYRGMLVGARGDLAEQERIWRDCIRACAERGRPIEWENHRLAEMIQLQRPEDQELEGHIRHAATNIENLTPSHPLAGVSHLAYARLLLDRGKSDSEPYLKLLQEFMHQKTIRGNYRIGVVDSLLGACLAAQGRPDEAEPLLLAGVENLRKSRNDNHRLTREAVSRLVKFYRQMGRDVDAARYAEFLTTESVPAGASPTNQ